MSIKTAVFIVATCLLLVVGLFAYNRSQLSSVDLLPASGSAEDRQVYMRAAELSGVFNTASLVKMRMTEYYQDTGEYPRDNLELGIDPPYKFANNRVLDLSVDNTGEIVIHFKQERGVFPAIRLTVDETLIKTGMLRWTCTTEHFADALLAVIPQCEKYDPDAVTYSAAQSGNDRASAGDSAAVNSTGIAKPQKGYLAWELAGHIKEGNDSMIEQMLADGVVVGGEPVFAAVSAGQFDLVQKFLSMGADVNSIDVDGNSLLLTALFSDKTYPHEHIDLIRLLLNSGADINYVSPFNQTALLSLYIPERPDYLGSSPDVDDAEILKYRAALQETYGVAKLLLDQGARLNVTAANNHSALSHAVWAGAGKLVDLYMQHGASGDSWDGRQKYLLDVALKKGYAETALLLFEHGAQLELSEARHKNERLLILALQQHAKDVVDTMLALGADASRRVPFTTLGVVSAMEYGLVEQDWRSVLKFLERGVEPPCKVKLYGSAPAEKWPQATQGSRTMLPIFQYILETGGAAQAVRFMPHLTACDVYRDSALHYVLANEHAELVLPLINAGASLEVRDQQGRSLFDVSIEHGDETSALIFFKRQALPESTDELQALWHRATEHDMTKLADEVGELLLAVPEHESESESVAQDPIVEPVTDELTYWQISCKSEAEGWFAMRATGDLEQLLFASGFKTIPYPGFWKPLDVYSDRRFKWISADELQLKNIDKDAGWEGYKTFHRCKGVQADVDLSGRWQTVSEVGKKYVFNLQRDGDGHISLENRVIGLVKSVEPAYRGVKLVLSTCQEDEDIVMFIKAGTPSVTGSVISAAAYEYKAGRSRGKVELKRLAPVETDRLTITDQVQVVCP